MSGHSHWAGIRHKKGTADAKRGVLFAKLLSSISVAAKDEPNPEFNPRLRTAVEKAKSLSVPKEKIDGAIKRASETSQNLEGLTFEAYGPGGAAIIIEAVSDSKNRTVAEIKKLLGEFGGKWAESGSVLWAFEKAAEGRRAKFPQELDADDKARLSALAEALDAHEDVQKVYTNLKP